MSKTNPIISRGVEAEKKQELNKKQGLNMMRLQKPKVFCIASKQNRNDGFAIAGKLN